MQKTSQAGRPVVFDYKNPADFLRDLGEYYRKTRRGYSIRSRAKDLSGCSPALISQIIKGQRKLKRDHLVNFAQIFSLNATEVNHIDGLLKADQNVAKFADPDLTERNQVTRTPKNHLLTDWLNPYVKDLVELKGFKLESKWMLQHLGFAASVGRIEKSARFLLREGFWRKTVEGKIVPEESAVITTNEIPNEKIKDFHRQALKLAVKGLADFPVHRRKASTVLVAVNTDSKDELKALIDKFQNDLLAFIERHPKEKEELVQVTVHMTPVGGDNANS